MASSTTGDRLKKINDLKFFIKDVEERVKGIADELNWDYQELTENEDSLKTCSIYPEHRIGHSRIKEHEDKCEWLKDGYHAEDIALPEFHGNGSYIVLTPELQKRIISNTSESCNLVGETSIRGIPQTSFRFDTDFTREEKLAIYDYVIANTEKQKLYTDLAFLTRKEDKTEEKIMSPLEIAAAERDAKRRRASYRNKVHTNRKTHTEVLREVIGSQMEALAEEISFEKDSKVKYRNEAHYSNSGYSKKVHKSDRSHKYSGYKDREKYYSDRDTKYKDRHLREEKRNKSKKRKRSRSRSKSRDKIKYKMPYSHSSHHSSVRH